MFRNRAFSLLETLAAVAVISLLGVLMMIGGRAAYARSSLAVSASNIRVLAVGSAQYLAENNYRFWKYRQSASDGIVWWWGVESWRSLSSGEGSRAFDASRGPLGDFIPAGTRPDPSFALSGSAFKPKYRTGYIGIGYNVLLGGGFLGGKPVLSYWQLSDPSKVVVFATSAQVYPFSSKPRIEEFYGIDQREATVHFRHNGMAMVAYANGSSGFLPPTNPPSTNDSPRRKSGDSLPSAANAISNDISELPRMKPPTARLTTPVLCLALGLLLFGAFFRVFRLEALPALPNFAPLMAIALCGALVLPGAIAVIVPLAALIASDILLNFHYGYSAIGGGELLRYALYAIGITCGIALRNRRAPVVFGAVAANSFLFYAVTNTAAWFGNPGYAQTTSGWLQSLTVGLPGFPPTWVFFRNSLASDLIFAALFLGALALQRKRLTSQPPAQVLVGS